MFLPYTEFDNICMFEPDPPWACVPQENDAFLRERFLLVNEQGVCPYCRGQIEKSSLGLRNWPERMEEFFKFMHVGFYGDSGETYLYRCASCGWWMTFRFTTEHMTSEEEDFHSLIDLISVNYAKLKVFDTAPLETPLEQLKRYLPKKSFLSSTPTPSKVATSIAQCFRQFFPCEVVYIGESNTNAHTFLIQSDNPALIAVGKNPDDEPKLIREVLWVDMGNSHPTAMWVSTENRFNDVDKVLPQLIQNEFAVRGNLDAVFSVLPKPQDSSFEPWEKPWQK